MKILNVICKLLGLSAKKIGLQELSVCLRGSSSRKIKEEDEEVNGVGYQCAESLSHPCAWVLCKTP